MINKITGFLSYYDISEQKVYFIHLAYNYFNIGVTGKDNNDIYLRSTSVRNSKHIFLKTEGNRLEEI